MRLVLRSPKHYFASKKTVPLIVQWSAKFCKCSINSTLAQNNSAPKRRFNLLNALQNKIPQRALLEALTCLCGNKLVQNTTMPSYKSFYNTTVNRTIVAVSQVAILLDMAGHQPASKGDVPMVQPYEPRQAKCFLFASCKPMVRSSADGSTSQRERILRSRG